MAEILQNRKNLSVVIHTTANASLIIAGNSAVSNVATSDEILTGAAIKQLWWGSQPSGVWIVKRGSNTIGVYEGSGWADYAGNGCMLNKDAAANLVFELVGTANGYCMLELQKIGTFTSDY